MQTLLQSSANAVQVVAYAIVNNQQNEEDGEQYDEKETAQVVARLRWFDIDGCALHVPTFE